MKNENYSVNVEINEIDRYFPETKFSMFRTYCLGKGIDTLQKAMNIDFSELMRTRGLGEVKLNAIRERLEQLEVKANIVVREEALDVNKFFTIHESNEFLPISILRRFDIPSIVTARLAALGIQTFFDIKRESKFKIVQLFGTQNYNKLEEAFKQFELPLVDIVETYFKTHEQSKSFDMYIQRAEGNTLQKIGADYHLTRERIRQCCSDFERAVAPMIIALARGLENSNSAHYIKKKQFFSLFSNADYCKIVILALTNASLYDSVGDIFFNKKYYPNIQKDLHRIVSNIIGNGISISVENEKIKTTLEDAGYGFINDRDFVSIAIEFKYYFDGDQVVNKAYKNLDIDFHGETQS